MNIFEEIMYEKHRLLMKEETDISKKSEEWLEAAINQFDGIMQNLLLAQIYYLRANTRLEFDDAVKACQYYEKIPFSYYTKEIVADYTSSLKMCYQFDKAIELLKKLIEKPQWFCLEYFCLNELSDDSMVSDGAISIEEHNNYKAKLLSLLKKEMEYVKHWK